MNEERLNTFFTSLNNLTVMVIGDAILDSYLWGEVGGISPEAPVPFVRVNNKEHRLGGAANVAANIRSLGASPILCTIVGNDRAGSNLQSCMDENDMLGEGILISEKRPTTVKTRVIAHQRHIVRVDEETTDSIDADEERRLMQCIETLMPRCDVVIFEDYDKGVITPELIAKTTSLASAKGIPVVVDPKKKNFFSYEKVALIKPNLKELNEVFNLQLTADNQHALAGTVATLRQKLDTNVLVTLSSAGMLLDYKTERIRLPAHPMNIVDVSGAGDTVVGIAALCVALDFEPRLLAMLSNLGGGLVCKRVGVVPVDKDELWREAKAIIRNRDL